MDTTRVRPPTPRKTPSPVSAALRRPRRLLASLWATTEDKVSVGICYNYHQGLIVITSRCHPLPGTQDIDKFPISGESS